MYGRERQPQVVRRTDRFLDAMAHGRYRLLAAVGEERVHLEDKSLARKKEVAWSAGWRIRSIYPSAWGWPGSSPPLRTRARRPGRRAGEVRPVPAPERRRVILDLPGAAGPPVFLPAGTLDLITTVENTPRPPGNRPGLLCHRRRGDQPGQRTARRRWCPAQTGLSQDILLIATEAPRQVFPEWLLEGCDGPGTTRLHH